ncbi:hypothetical protein BDZ97DRAFT_1759982 [Flammula alnicola]|nr:hypothetical protein BDZ97DRAFT_1759982 [Flammula alnicola]
MAPGQKPRDQNIPSSEAAQSLSLRYQPDSAYGPERIRMRSGCARCSIELEAVSSVEDPPYALSTLMASAEQPEQIKKDERVTRASHGRAVGPGLDVERQRDVYGQRRPFPSCVGYSDKDNEEKTSHSPARKQLRDVPARAWPESPGFGPALGGSGFVKSRAGPKAGNQAWPGPALAQAGALSNFRESTVQKKAPAWADGSGFSKPQAGPKPAPGQYLWPGLARLFWARLGSASGLRPEPAHHYLKFRYRSVRRTCHMLAA